jgi:hypothetical protein
VATHAQRLHVKSFLDLLYLHRAQLDYPPGDQRDNRDAAWWAMSEQQIAHVLAAGGRLSLDCSELGPKALRNAGAWPWSQAGYTGSHLQTLPHYTNARGALIGALVVFGGGTGHHEAVVVGPDPKGGNPLLQSHGRPGMDRVRLKDLAASQAASGHPGVTLLSIAHL